MSAGDLARIELDVTLAVPAEEQDRLVEQDARAVGQGEQVCGHGGG
jgi:hypothetical protein